MSEISRNILRQYRAKKGDNKNQNWSAMVVRMEVVRVNLMLAQEVRKIVMRFVSKSGAHKFISGGSFLVVGFPMRGNDNDGV